MTAPAEAPETEAVETPEEGPRLLRSITLRNILSFGPETPPLELRSLNVLIGPNGSGKSNLIDALARLRSADPQEVVAEGGGVGEWIWKGAPDAEASVEADGNRLAFRNDGGRFRLLEKSASGCEGIRIYRDWAFGARTAFRAPQRADQPADHLAEDFSNLFLVLERLRSEKGFLKQLRHLYDGLDDFAVRTEAGFVHLEFTEEGGRIIPTSRLSDGSLRYLCLLAILCDPEPPQLVCIEEPELGLHPDLMIKLADLLAGASERTQLVVTTHSESLVDTMTEHPESVVVLEKRNGRPTTMERVIGRKLGKWLEEEGLSVLWSRGVLGGTRW